MNNKGFTVVELIITFVIVMTISLGLFSTVDSYRERQQQELYRKEITSYRNEIMKAIENDITRYSFDKLEKLDVTVSGSLCEGYDQGLKLYFKKLTDGSTVGKAFCFGNNKVAGKSQVKYGDIKYTAPTKFIKFEQDIIDTTTNNLDTGIANFAVDSETTLNKLKSSTYNHSRIGTNIGYIKVYTVKKDIYSIKMRMKHEEIKNSFDMQVTFTKPTGKKAICDLNVTDNKTVLMNLSQYNGECGKYALKALNNAGLAGKDNGLVIDVTSGSGNINKIENIAYAAGVVVRDAVDVEGVSDGAFSGVGFKVLDLSTSQVHSTDTIGSKLIADSSIDTLKINNVIFSRQDIMGETAGESFAIGTLDISANNLEEKPIENYIKPILISIYKKMNPEMSEEVILAYFESDDGKIAISDAADSMKFDDKETMTGYLSVSAMTESKCNINGTLKNIIIPQGVTRLYPNQFANCGISGSVTIPNSVKLITGDEFSTNPITKLTIGAKEIVKWSNPLAQMDVKITSGTQKIGANAFPMINNVELGYENGAYKCSVSHTDIKDYVNQYFEETYGVAINVDCKVEKNINPNMIAFKYIDDSGTEKVAVMSYPIQAVKKLDLSTATSLQYIGNSAFSNATKEYEDAGGIHYRNKLNKMQLSGIGSTKLKTIGDFAFAELNLSTNITLPNTLEKIGAESFRNSKLKGSLTIPSLVTEIGEKAFYKNNIESLILTEGNLTAIRDSAFEENDITGTLNLPSKLEYLGNNVFGSGNKISGSLNLPATLKSIGSGCFYNNEIVELNIENATSLTEIGGVAFFDNKISNELIFDFESISIGNNAFQNNDIKNLKIDMPASKIKIGKEAFYGNNLDYVEIKECSGNIDSKSIDDICWEPSASTGKYYRYGSTIKKIKVNSGQIGSDAFNKIALEEVELGENVTYIGASAFADNQLSTLTFPPNLTKIMEYAFNNNKLTGELIIPEGVTSIGKQSFERNSLHKVTIPSTVTSIGEYAFLKQTDSSNNWTLETIYINRLSSEVGSLIYNSWYDSGKTTLTYKDS